MTEQELRDEFEGSCSYRLEDGYEYVIRFEYFKAGYYIAQETIKKGKELGRDVDNLLLNEQWELEQTIEKQKKEIELRFSDAKKAVQDALIARSLLITAKNEIENLQETIKAKDALIEKLEQKIKDIEWRIV